MPALVRCSRPMQPGRACDLVPHVWYGHAACRACDLGFVRKRECSEEACILGRARRACMPRGSAQPSACPSLAPGRHHRRQPEPRRQGSKVTVQPKRCCACLPTSTDASGNPADGPSCSLWPPCHEAFQCLLTHAGHLAGVCSSQPDCRVLSKVALPDEACLLTLTALQHNPLRVELSVNACSPLSLCNMCKTAVHIKHPCAQQCWPHRRWSTRARVQMAPPGPPGR